MRTGFQFLAHGTTALTGPELPHIQEFTITGFPFETPKNKTT
jgi:hypothetical protein